MVHQRRAGRERCVGCGFGKGQFQVEYESESGSGRGYCSLDCYTSAKVTGRNLQTRRSGGDGMLYNQQHRRGAGGASEYGGAPQPQPWPTGLLVDAPPSPKPWRGRTLSQDSMSWRTVSTSNLSVADESSSQESSVADWRESEDGETSVGSGNGSAGGGGIGNADGSGGAAGLPPTQGARTAVNAGDSSGSGGGAAVRNGGSGGSIATRAAGGHRTGEAVCHGGGETGHRPEGARRAAIPGVGLDGDGDSSRGFVGTGPPGGTAPRGEVAHRPPLVPLAPIPLVPLAPIPRLGAFPAQRRVHGAYGSGADGGRRVPVRTVAFAAPPAAQGSPPPQPPGGRGAVVGAEAVPLRPPPAAAGQQQQQQQAGTTGVGVGVVGGAPCLGLIIEEEEEGFPAGDRGGGGGGGKHLGKRYSPAATSSAAAATAGPRREPASPNADGAAVAHPELGDEKESVGVPKARFAGGEDAAGGEESEASATGMAICIVTGTTKVQVSCGRESNSGGGLSARGGAPARRTAGAVSTKVFKRQWRSLFLP